MSLNKDRPITSLKSASSFLSFPNNNITQIPVKSSVRLLTRPNSNSKKLKLKGMGNKFENICSCDTYCLNKEIKTDPNEVNEEGSMLKKKKTAQFNQYKVSNVIKETISSTRRLKNSDENMILLNTAKNTNTISSNKDLSFNSSLSCITINSCFSENIEEEEEKEKENKLELKKKIMMI